MTHFFHETRGIPLVSWITLTSENKINLLQKSEARETQNLTQVGMS